MTIDNNKQKKPLTNDDLMGLIVHSYNNYLAGIMGYSELALLECENAEVEERLKHSLESGIEAVHFGKTILASLGRLQIPMQDCSLVKIIQSVGEKQKGLISQSDIAMLENFRIKTDPNWFEDCLLDLVEFVTFVEKGNKLNLNCVVNEKNNLVTIEIKCSKLFSEQDASQLFECFYSSRKITGKKDIGLAKARGFFTQMNAKLSHKNESGFVLEFPVEPRT